MESKYKLKKIGENYWFVHGVFFIGCSNKDMVNGDCKYKLNKSQIETLLVVDYYLDKLARKHCNINHDRKLDEEERYYKDYQKYDGFCMGYKACLENNSDKKFTLEDINKALSYGYHSAKDEEKGINSNGYGTRFLQSLEKEKNEWEVEIELEYQQTVSGLRLTDLPMIPKINSDGFVNILKLINN